MDEIWHNWPGPTGTTGPAFLGVTGAVTGPAFFGVTGASGPTGVQPIQKHMQYLFTRARIELVGASDAMIRQIMYDMFHEFFNGTSLWLEAIPGLLYPGTQFYYLQPGNPQSLGDPFPKGTIVSLAGVCDLVHSPVSADMPEPPIMRLQYTPSNPQSVWATVIKNVRPPATGDLPKVPSWVVGVYEPYLLAGIKGKLQLQSDRPYSDPKMGTINYQFFRQGVSIGRVRALRRNTFGGQAWAFPQTFRTRTQHSWPVSGGQVGRF